MTTDAQSSLKRKEEEDGMGGVEREERKEVTGGGKEAQKSQVGGAGRKLPLLSLRSFILRLLANTPGFARSTLMG